MNKDTAIRKILACLRLAESSNANEAAAALRQARALMDKYGLDQADAYASSIESESVKTRYRGAIPPTSMLQLANIVASGFRCEIVIKRGCLLASGSTTFEFFGAAADVKVASYAFTVLRRQLDAARLKHIARVRKRANRERRGEEFALGWVYAVGGLFPASELDADHKAAIERAISKDNPSLTSTSGRDLTKKGRAEANDGAAGYAAGKQAQLHSGLDSAKQRALGLRG